MRANTRLARPAPSSNPMAIALRNLKETLSLGAVRAEKAVGPTSYSTASSRPRHVAIVGSFRLVGDGAQAFEPVLESHQHPVNSMRRMMTEPPPGGDPEA